MWKNRYKIYRTLKPEFIITAVKSFPNIVDTVDKAISYYKVKELQSDETLLNIYSLYNLFDGRDFIPLYFEDDVPKLKKLKPISPGMFWCIGYMSPYLKLQDNKYTREMQIPSHIELKEFLVYAFSKKLDDIYIRFLFDMCIHKYIYEQTTSYFTQNQKHRLFQLIQNTKMYFPYNDKYNLNDCIDFIEAMYTRNIYEFIFNEFMYRPN